jgi:cell division protease FtsH
MKFGITNFISCVSVGITFINGFLLHQRYNVGFLYNNKYPLSKPHYEKFFKQIKNNANNANNSDIGNKKYYPISKNYYENFIKRLNSKNISEQNNEILGLNNQNKHHPHDEDDDDFYEFDYEHEHHDEDNDFEKKNKTIRVVLSKPFVSQLFTDGFNIIQPDKEPELSYDFYKNKRTSGSENRGENKKSDNFEVIYDSETNFTAVGGYESIKNELTQCIDLLKNYTKYSKFNVRVPKGLIFEGPPGNGKTLLAKALSGEAKTGFISVSGSQFQEMYVGVGAARIRELFKLAEKNIPCIIFIDEIDALGRSRGSDKETSSAERDSTLNELLVALDGFKTKAGIFIIGATNRADLLDPALLRPGRIDKRMYIGNPDEAARRAIIKIHSKGKPRVYDIIDDDLIEITNGFSAAQIENLLNEAMLNALRYNREEFTQEDIDIVYNKVLVGWQPSDHIFTSEMLDKICIHEMGHAVVGLMARNHSKVKKVIINLSSPNSPGYTLFEKSNSNIYNRDTLFEHLMILLAGRIAEELFYGNLGVSTGAISDFEEAFTLANKMINYYGMGEKIIYPSNSEKYKELIDNEITKLIQDAYTYASNIIDRSKDIIYEGALLLKEKRMLTANELKELMKNKY